MSWWLGSCVVSCDLYGPSRLDRFASVQNEIGDDLFELAGRKREDYVEFVQLDPFYRIFDHTGKSFDYNGDS